MKYEDAHIFKDIKRLKGGSQNIKIDDTNWLVT